jgi:hypothetical protein
LNRPCCPDWYRVSDRKPDPYSTNTSHLTLSHPSRVISSEFLPPRCFHLSLISPRQRQFTASETGSTLSEPEEEEQKILSLFSTRKSHLTTYLPKLSIRWICIHREPPGSITISKPTELSNRSQAPKKTTPPKPRASQQHPAVRKVSRRDGNLVRNNLRNKQCGPRIREPRGMLQTTTTTPLPNCQVPYLLFGK